MTLESFRSSKRFYSSVEVARVAEVYVIKLDGRIARTPAGGTLSAPTLALAEQIAGEWRAQKKTIAWTSMRATSLAFAAIDAIPSGRRELIDELVAFAGDDLICYFASAPAALIQRQEASWTPLIAWAKTDLGLEFKRFAGVIHQDQPSATLQTVGRMGHALDTFRLAGLCHAARLFGSTILALALMRIRLGAMDATAAAQLDETFQAEQWGQDGEAGARRRETQAEAAMLQDWFAALDRS